MCIMVTRGVGVLLASLLLQVTLTYSLQTILVIHTASSLTHSVPQILVRPSGLKRSKLNWYLSVLPEFLEPHQL